MTKNEDDLPMYVLPIVLDSVTHGTNRGGNGGTGAVLVETEKASAEPESVLARLRQDLSYSFAPYGPGLYSVYRDVVSRLFNDRRVAEQCIADLMKQLAESQAKCRVHEAKIKNQHIAISEYTDSHYVRVHELLREIEALKGHPPVAVDESAPVDHEQRFSQYANDRLESLYKAGIKDAPSMFLEMIEEYIQKAGEDPKNYDTLQRASNDTPWGYVIEVKNNKR